MNTQQDFKAFYNTTLLTELNKLEKMRKIILLNIIILLLLIVTSFVFAYQGFDNVISLGFKPISVIIIISFIIGISFNYLLMQKYIKLYKNNIIKKIIYFINPNLEYAPQCCVNINHLINSALLESLPNVYYGDDHVCGTVGSTNIEFSEIYIGEKYQDKTKEIFKGLFFIADFGKPFEGLTIVLPDRQEQYLGYYSRFIQSLDKKNGQLVQLEDAEFENNFVVYSDNQITARYILSTSLMNRIVSFKNKTNSDLFISFVNSVMYLAIPIWTNLFEPNIFKSITDYSKIELYYSFLDLFIGIVKDLGLNTRIWTSN